MNIRVDLEMPIRDGTEVVFRSPVDCSQVTGLIVYYKESGNTTSKEFAFADAHGNNVGDIDHLFAENVVVKVILDVTTSMAFVQNADTNAYLEWRFRDTIDKCCPSFTESGAIVTCEPVEGYPLTVTAEEGATAITRCGKNLLNEDWRKYESYTNNLLTLQLPDGNYVFSAETSAPTFLYLDCYTKDGTRIDRLYIFTDSSTNLTQSRAFTVDSTKDEVWKIRGSTQINLNKIDWIQIETGSQFTSYEPYQEKAFAVGETIPALRGVNNIFADVGNITVTGKADPTAIIEKLTKAVDELTKATLSMGGNV